MRLVHSFDKNYSFGGKSYAVEEKDGVLYCGISHCSINDQFNKRIGREIAEKRLNDAFKKYDSNRSDNDLDYCLTVCDYTDEKWDRNGSFNILYFAVPTSFVLDCLFDNMNLNFYSHFRYDSLALNINHIEGNDIKYIIETCYKSIYKTLFDKYNEEDWLI